MGAVVVVSIWGGGVVRAGVGDSVGAAVGSVVGSMLGPAVGVVVGLGLAVVVTVVCGGVLVEETASSDPHPSTSAGQLQTPISASQAVPAGHWKRYCWNCPVAQRS